MSKYKKYTSTGGLNPFWVDEQCMEAQAEADYEVAMANLEYGKQQERLRLEARMEFLKSYMGDAEDLELAKIILNS
jgi:hypothetical protein